MPPPADPYFDDVYLNLFMAKRLRQIEAVREKIRGEEEQRQREREQLCREFKTIRNDRRWHILANRLLQQWWKRGVWVRVVDCFY